MTRITVHAVGDRLVVCDDGGRRWMLDVSGEEIAAPAVQEALAAVRAVPMVGSAEASGSGGAARAAGAGRSSGFADRGRAVEVASMAGLRELARGCRDEVVVLWRYAGRAHRIRLAPEDAVEVVDLVDAVLRAGIDDPDLAEVLAQEPLVADPLFADAGRADPATLDPGSPDPVAADAPLPVILEREEGERWVPHPLRPAPVVDPVTGLLRRIVARPVEEWHPAGFRHLHAELPHLGSVDPRFQPDPLAPAGAFVGGPDAPAHAAVLSGIAHYCGAYLGQGERRRATANQLRTGGDRVLTATEWRPHDPALHDLPGFPFVRHDDDAVTWWLAGVEHGERCWAPLPLVHAGYMSSGLHPLPATNGHNLVGLQAGVGLADAADRAAAHVIAHDAVARWWRGHDRVPSCDPPESVRAALAEAPADITVLALPSATGIPVRLVVVDDPRDDIIGLGFAAASDPQVAVARAAAEALIQHASARDLAREASLIRDAERLGNGGVAGLAPFDPDRGYAEGAFADQRRLIDPMCQVQYGLSASSVARVRRRAIPRGSVVEPVAGSGPLAALRSTAERVVVVDVTTPRVRETDLAACRVLATGFDRIAVAAFPTDIRDVAPYPGW